MSTSSLARRRSGRVARPHPVGRSRSTAALRPTPAQGRGRSDGARSGRWRRLLRDDAGMSTVEYAIGCIAAAAFAAALYAVVSGESVVTALTQLVQRALTAGF